MHNHFFAMAALCDGGPLPHKSGFPENFEIFEIAVDDFLAIKNVLSVVLF